MNVLLHVCCGPCAIYPVSVLRKQGHDLTGLFYNPNIHPFKEFRRRLTTLQSYAETVDLDLICDENYGLTEFIRKTAFNEQKRCTICYLTRIEETAKIASQQGFTGFTTTLLYSRYQQHELLVKTCHSFADTYGVEFIYHDFREGWQSGIDQSIKREMYRQPYCGCIYSEQERYDKSLRKKSKQQN